MNEVETKDDKSEADVVQDDSQKLKLIPTIQAMWKLYVRRVTHQIRRKKGILNGENINGRIRFKNEDIKALVEGDKKV